MKIGAVLLSICLAMPSIALAHIDIKSASPQGYLSRGIMMHANKNMVGAIDQLTHTYMMDAGDNTLETADMLIALSTFERGDKNCIKLFERFIANYPTSINVPLAWAKIGDCYFYNGLFGEAISAYENVDPGTFNGEYKSDLIYRKGYSLLKLAEYDRAADLFKRISSTKQYRHASLFYEAYIDYARKDYDSAAEKFEKINKNSELGKAARYYLCQIHFVNNEYNHVISLGKDLIGESEGNIEYNMEMHRLVGESYYHDGNDEIAGNHLKQYFNNASDPMRSALYIMGILDYRNLEFENAIEHLGKTTGEEDALAQSAYLYIGQSYLRTGNMNAASIAFEKALEMPFDRAIQETAFYNYAITQNEGGRTPFNRSIDIFEQFLNKFPNSRYASSVENYLINAYFTSNDYERALQSISHISQPSSNVLAAKQNVLYQLGVQALSNEDTKHAIDYFRQAKAVGKYDAAVINECDLWIGECLYRQGAYDKAEKSINAFIRSSDKSNANRAIAYYNLGYARFQQRDYADARNAFNAAIGNSNLQPSLKADALNRIGDTYYYAQDYSTASSYYEMAYTSGGESAGDYSLYQKAMMLGLQRDYKSKINMLDQMLRQFPKSPLCPTALLQKAESYVNLGNNKSAIDTYKVLMSQYPNSPDTRKGILQLAITERNAGNMADAINAYKTVITRYPTSEEAAVAAEDLKLMYADAGDLQQYIDFINNVPNAPKIDVDDIDRLAFEAAEKAYLKNNTDISKLEAYVKEHPNGAYVGKARYYIAIRWYKDGKYDDALALIDNTLASSADAAFAEDALRIKGDILMKQGKFEDALDTFKVLAQKASKQDNIINANLGIIRAADQLEKYSDMRESADKLLKMGGLSAEEEKEATFCRAIANLNLSNGRAAADDFKTLTKDTRNIYGARAAYELANYYFGNNDNVAAEDVLNKFIEGGTPHQYWLARGFILLADIYHKKGNNFEAIQYIKSLKENYPGDEQDIYEMIDTRLNQWENGSNK